MEGTRLYTNMLGLMTKWLYSFAPSGMTNTAINLRVNPIADWAREVMGRTEVLWIFNAESLMKKPDAMNGILDTKVFWREFRKNLVYEAANLGRTYNLLASSTKTLTETILSISTMLVEGLIPESKDIYRFRINPTRAGWDYKKMQRKTNYGYGVFDLEDYGDEMIKLSLDNTTGYLMPPEPLKTLGFFDLMFTEGYQKLAELEKYYLGSKQRLFLYYFRTFYYGWLTDLHYDHDASNPFQIKFKIGFELHPYFKVPLFGKQQQYTMTKFQLPKVNFTLADAIYPSTSITI